MSVVQKYYCSSYPHCWFRRISLPWKVGRHVKCWNEIVNITIVLAAVTRGIPKIRLMVLESRPSFETSQLDLLYSWWVIMSHKSWPPFMNGPKSVNKSLSSKETLWYSFILWVNFSTTCLNYAVSGAVKWWMQEACSEFKSWKCVAVFLGLSSQWWYWHSHLCC